MEPNKEISEICAIHLLSCIADS